MTGNGNGCALSAPPTCSGNGNGDATSANFTGNRTEGALTHVFHQGARLQAYSETGSAAQITGSGNYGTTSLYLTGNGIEGSAHFSGPIKWILTAVSYIMTLLTAYRDNYLTISFKLVADTT